MKYIFVSFLRVYHRTTLHNPAHPALRKLPGRMLTRQHDIEQHTDRINIGTSVRLRHPILFRRCKSGRSKDLRILLHFIFLDSCSIEIDQDRLVSPQDHVVRLNIPMYHAH